MKYFQSTLVVIVLSVIAGVNCQGCDRLEPIPDGSISFRPDPDPSANILGVGTIATYGCNPTHALDPRVAMRTCRMGPGNLFFWLDDEPACVLALCPVLDPPNNGAVMFDTELITLAGTGYIRGTQATYNCSENFRLTGVTNIICEVMYTVDVDPMARWSSPPPICEPQCPDLDANFTRGIIRINIDRTPITGIAVYECFPGYVATTSLVRNCNLIDNSTARWSEPDDPNCDPTCVELPSIPNGVITYSTTPVLSDRYGIGTDATYTCDDGFVLNGTYNVRMCERMLEGEFYVAQWNREPAPTCERVQCPMLPPLGNGSIDYREDMSPDYDLGTVASHSCDFGFELEGPEERTCTVNPATPNNPVGEWLPSPGPVCRPICLELSLSNGVITYRTDTTPPFSVGTIATHTCNPGFALVGDVERTCVDSLTWSAEVVPTCQPIQCPMLPPLGNGSIDYAIDMTPDYDPGTVASHSCDLGFELEGPEERTCTGIPNNPVGEWLPSPGPVCRPICLELSLSNGVITYRTDTMSPFSVGTIATHTCNPGFALVGDVERTCVDSLTWSAEVVPTCQPIQCPILPPLGNGSIDYAIDMTPDYDPGTVASHRCDFGFELEGPEERTCTAIPNNPIGIWLPSPGPVCRPICLELSLSNGVITYRTDTSSPFSVGTIATHTCNPGFALVGDVERTCVDSLTWLAVVAPTCQPIMCPPLDEPPNGRLIYSPDVTPDFTLGTTAISECDSGFTPMGGPKTCEQFNSTSVFGVWTGPPCTCEANTCPPLPQIANGMITYNRDSGPTGRFSVGTEASYRCTTNYCLGEIVTRICLANESWSGSEPECEPIVCGVLPLPGGNVTYSGGPPFPIGTVANLTCSANFVLVGTSTAVCESPGNIVVCRRGEWNIDTTGLMCIPRPTRTVNDTATGDPLLTIPLYIQDKSALVNPVTGLSVLNNQTVNLCFEVHGRNDAFFNLVSDVCTHVNSRYDLVLPDTPQEDINIIDNIYVRAIDNNGNCRNLSVALNEGGVCTASVDNSEISSVYQRAGITVRRYRNRVRIVVPNCNTNGLNLVMWVFCQRNTFWSTFRVDSSGREQTFEAYMLRFVIARGVNLEPTSHGIIGQFWNIPIQVDPFNGQIRDNTLNLDNYYEITVDHPNAGDIRRFSGWLWPLTWEYREEYCLYAGNQQAGPVYEVLSPNDPVIEGTYAAYQVDDSYSTEFMFNRFEEFRCSN